MVNTLTVIKLLLKKFLLGNVILTLIMAAVLFLANMLVSEYTLSSSELTCYKKLARQNVIFVEADEANFDFDDSHITAIYAYKSDLRLVNGQEIIVQYFSSDYLSQLDAGVNRGKWFDGSVGQCITVDFDASVGNEVSIGGVEYKVIGKINENDYYPVIHVYQSVPVRNLSLLWDNETIPSIIVSAENNSIDKPTHYVVLTDAPADTLKAFSDIPYTMLSTIYENSRESATYNQRVVLPLAVMSTILAVLAIIVIAGIMIEKSQKLFLVFTLYGGSKAKGLLSELVYLTVLIVISVALGVGTFLLSNNLALNTASKVSIALTDIAMVLLYYISFTLCFAVKNRLINYKKIKANKI